MTFRKILVLFVTLRLYVIATGLKSMLSTRTQPNTGELSSYKDESRPYRKTSFIRHVDVGEQSARGAQFAHISRVAHAIAATKKTLPMTPSKSPHPAKPIARSHEKKHESKKPKTRSSKDPDSPQVSGVAGPPTSGEGVLGGPTGPQPPTSEEGVLGGPTGPQPPTSEEGVLGGPTGPQPPTSEEGVLGGPTGPQPPTSGAENAGDLTASSMPQEPMDTTDNGETGGIEPGMEQEEGSELQGGEAEEEAGLSVGEDEGESALAAGEEELPTAGPQGQTGTLPTQQGQTGTLTAQQGQTGTLPAPQGQTGTLPTQQEQTGTLPAQQEQTGTLPAQQGQTGTLPTQQGQTGTLPTQQGQAGTLPAQQAPAEATQPMPLEVTQQGELTITPTQPSVVPISTQPLSQPEEAPVVTPTITTPYQAPPETSAIQDCPEQVESLGCFVKPPTMFTKFVASKSDSQNLEQFFCHCGSLVEKQGWTAFALTDGQCYAAPTKDGYESAGETDQCINDIGEECTNKDTYCQGKPGSMTVYSIEP